MFVSSSLVEVLINSVGARDFLLGFASTNFGTFAALTGDDGCYTALSSLTLGVSINGSDFRTLCF